MQLPHTIQKPTSFPPSGNWASPRRMSLGASDCTRERVAKPRVISEDDRWLREACEKLSRGDNWSVAHHHRARMDWIAKNPVTFWTDALRQLAWNACLQYPQVAEECGVKLRPMPAAVRDAKIIIPKLTHHIIHADRTHFHCAVSQLDTYAWLCVRSAEMQWASRRSAFACRITAVTATRMHKLALDYGFTLADSASEAIDAMRQESRELAALSASAAGSFVVDGLACVPHPYQQAGIEYLCRTKRAFLADDMGLGKTLQALASVQHLSAWPCGVVTLATVKDCWKNEVAKWLPSVACYVWSGKTGEPVVHGPADSERVVHVINYDILPARLAEWQELGLSSLNIDE